MNYDCQEIFAALSQYLDAELPAADCEAIQAHIAACPPCVEFVNSLKKTIALCRQPMDPPGPPPSVPDGVREKLLAAFRASIPAESGR